MRNVIINSLVIFALALGSLSGCAALNTATSGSITSEQAAAGAEYLEASVATLQTALDAAKATGDPVKVATAQAVLDSAKTAAATFKASTTESNWSFARSLISSAVSILAPIALKALLI